MTIDLNVFSRDPCFPSCKSGFAGADVLEHLKKYEQTMLRPQPRWQEIFVSSSLERHPDVDQSSGRKWQNLVFISLRVSMRGEFDAGFNCDMYFKSNLQKLFTCWHHCHGLYRAVMSECKTDCIK